MVRKEGECWSFATVLAHLCLHTLFFLCYLLAGADSRCGQRSWIHSFTPFQRLYKFVAIHDTRLVSNPIQGPN